MSTYIDVRVQCPGCGPVVVPAEEFCCELEAAGGRGICELRCPVCSAMLVVPARAEAVETMRRAGAGRLPRAPFELLEPHVGPPLSWDEVLDFTLAMDASQALPLL